MKRIQRSRKKGWRMPEGAVYVGRPTKYGNPWRIEYTPKHWPVPWEVVRDTPDGKVCFGGFGTAEDARYYAVWGYRSVTDIESFRAELAGHDLACWCPLDQPCHANALIDLLKVA